jgi:hypothetical protein
MSNERCSVGDGLSRAMARAEQLRQSSPRRVRVRIVTRHGDLDPGVIIVANITARTGPELEVQLSCRRGRRGCGRCADAARAPQPPRGGFRVSSFRSDSGKRTYIIHCAWRKPVSQLGILL